MSIESDLSFSNEALLTRVLFLSSETQLSVFVEDTNKEYEYEEIFERLLPKEISIDCIFPTGGKPFLETAFELFGSSNDYGKTFFIADGDFDIALGKEMISADNFVYLNKYNIESYLLHKDSVIRFMRPKLKRSLAETEKEINYDKWINEVTPFLKKIFSLHFVVQKHIPDKKNVALGYARFFDKRGKPIEEEFIKYKEDVEKRVPDIDTKIDEALHCLEKTYGSEIGCFICGKYYIGALRLFLNTKLNKGISDDELKSMFISTFDISQLEFVKTKLFNYLLS